MARYTNKNNLPDALVRSVTNDTYSKGECDYSVTELLRPARMRALEVLHKDEISEDVADRLWSLYGQIAHLILERAGGNELKETRFFADIDGKIISGQIDNLCLESGTLSDYKFVSAWEFLSNKPTKNDWLSQLNMQAELLRQNGHTPKKLQIVGLLRDYSKPESFRNPDYPQFSTVTREIPMWPSERVLAFMRLRISEHELANKDLSKVLCSKEERYSDPDQWAVMKKGQTRAVKLHLIENEAKLHAGLDTAFSVQHRPSISKRCEWYCSVSEFCEQFKKIKEKR